MNSKRLAAFGLSLTLLLALTACGGDEPEAPAVEETPEVTQPVEAPPADPSLTALREEMAADGEPLAIAFLGRLPASGGVTALVKEGDYLERYPFLADVTGAQIVSFEGSEVYCLVPQDPGASLTIQAVDDETPGEVLYQGDGQPVILVCNVSDVIPNTLVTLNDGEVAYSPTLSLCDGSVALPAGSTMGDFSIYGDVAPATAQADFLGTWTATIPFNDSSVVAELTFSEGGTMEYLVGYAQSEWMDIMEGTFYVMENNSQSPAGAVLFDMTSTMDPSTAPFWGVFTVEPSGGTLTITHLTGTALIYGTDGQPLVFDAK